MSTAPHRLAPLGLVMIRGVIPAWIVVGASMKLLTFDAGLLPRKTVLPWGFKAGLNIDYLLATLISIEFAVAAAIVLVGRLARPLAVLQLATFCTILVLEGSRGNWTDCGCLGSASPPPWVMLAVDGLLLLCAAFLPLPTPKARMSRMIAVATATAIFMAAVTGIRMAIYLNS